jgi:histidyl-tRNA synthetase
VYQIPRGTRDFSPKDMKKRRYIEDSIKTTFQKFGYKEIQTPMFENLDVFTAKSGDSIIEEIYSFKDKGGREIALRPELTAPVIRFYVDKLQMEPKPLKLFYLGNCFRYDRPQKGRYREFRQVGCEIIGVNSPEAYAELIGLAYSILKNIGLRNMKLYIGNLNVLNTIFETLKISKIQQKQLIPLIDKSQYTEISTQMFKFGIGQKVIDDFLDILQTSDIEKISKYLKNNIGQNKDLIFLKDIIKILESSFKIKDYQLKIGIVRGLDYYKGIVFEIDAPLLGAEKQLCGGGAYELIQLFGGRETPTAGFAIGFDRTILALESENYQFPSDKINIYIIPVDIDSINKSIEIAQNLRNYGIITDIDLLRRGISKALKYASSINAEKIIIVGPRELEKDSITLRDMVTGEQKLVKISEIVNKLK